MLPRDVKRFEGDETSDIVIYCAQNYYCFFLSPTFRTRRFFCFLEVSETAAQNISRASSRVTHSRCLTCPPPFVRLRDSLINSCFIAIGTDMHLQNLAARGRILDRHGLALFLLRDSC